MFYISRKELYGMVSDKIFMFVKNLWIFKTIAFARFLKSLGVLFSIEKLLELFDTSNYLKAHTVGLGVVLLIASIIWGVLFLLCKKKKIRLSINKRTKLSVHYGDLFNEQGVRVIPVNEYFDTHLGDGIIAANTIHGKFLTRLTAHITELRNMIDEQLSLKEALATNRVRSFVEGLPQNRYPLGTTIRITINNQTYLLVAVTRFNANEHVDVDDSEYMGIMQKMFSSIEQLNDAQTVNIPLIGGGQAGFGYSNMQLLNMMVQAACLTDRLAVVNGINIILYDGQGIKSSINLNVIKTLFENWKIL